MEPTPINIDGIPALVWGKPSGRAYLFVHGKMSCKEEAEKFAQIAGEKGVQVLSFDLPEHGERKNETTPCDVRHGTRDLLTVGAYAGQRWKKISLYAVSLGAYLSLQAYGDMPMERCLFVSPVLDMERLIQAMMDASGITEKTLEEQKRMTTSMGVELDWEDYCYVRKHPVEKWSAPTSILYPEKDDLTPRNVAEAFADRFHGKLTICPGGEHWFHTEEQLAFLQRWTDYNIR